MRKTALLLLLLGFGASADEEIAPPSDWKAIFAPEDDSWKSVSQELIFNNNAEPETLDPAIMTGVTEHTLALGLYEGLVSHDPETLEARPGVAERWTRSADARTYTFHFRADAKWSNGDPVTAQDFLWSWYRAIGEPTCNYAYLFDYIAGAAAWRKGRTGEARSLDEFQAAVGLSAPDSRTFVVRLEAPCAYFLDLCAFETYMPVHRATVEKHELAWTRHGNWVGNGAFRLVEWSPRKHIVMVPNEHYWDRDFVKLTKITVLPVDDLDQAWNKFLKREAHWIRQVPSAKIDEAKRHPEYFVQPYLGSYFYRVNVTREHLKDKRIRKALALALNRETITRDVTRAGRSRRSGSARRWGGTSR
ncbi:MAG: peptide ABC transporter substrate-binding protein [Planctomycetes bacterium]|nr:peptide ABC transporter substrate-binding protein [Planctomycetota bacterium]